MTERLRLNPHKLVGSVLPELPEERVARYARHSRQTGSDTDSNSDDGVKLLSHAPAGWHAGTPAGRAVRLRTPRAAARSERHGSTVKLLFEDWTIAWLRKDALLLTLGGILLGVGYLVSYLLPESTLAGQPWQQWGIVLSFGLGSTVAAKVLTWLFLAILSTITSCSRTLQYAAYLAAAPRGSLPPLLGCIATWVCYPYLVSTFAPPEPFFQVLTLLIVMFAGYGLRSIILRHTLASAVEHASAGKVREALQLNVAVQHLTRNGRESARDVATTAQRLLDRGSFLQQLSYVECGNFSIFDNGSLAVVRKTARMRRVAAESWDRIASIIALEFPASVSAGSVAGGDGDTMDGGQQQRLLRPTSLPQKGAGRRMPTLWFMPAAAPAEQPTRPAKPDSKVLPQTHSMTLMPHAAARATPPTAGIQGARASIRSLPQPRPAGAPLGAGFGTGPTALLPSKPAMPAAVAPAPPPEDEEQINVNHLMSFMPTDLAVQLLVHCDRNNSGTLSKAELVEGCARIFKDFKALRRSVTQNESVSKALTVSANVIYWVAIIVSAFLVFNVTWQEFFLPFSAVLLSLSFALGRLVQTVLHALMQVIGLRSLEPGDEVAMPAVFGGEAVTVERVDVLSSTVRRGNGRRIQIPNHVLADTLVENLTRSTTAAFTVPLIAAPGTPATTFVALRTSLEAYLREHPLEWKPSLYLSVDEYNAEVKGVRFSLSLTHVLTWKDGGRVHASRTDFLLYALQEMKRLGMEHGAVLEGLDTVRSALHHRRHRSASSSVASWGHDPTESARKEASDVPQMRSAAVGTPAHETGTRAAAAMLRLLRNERGASPRRDRHALLGRRRSFSDSTVRIYATREDTEDTHK